jgi:tRNA(Ile)-lysidine synthase
MLEKFRDYIVSNSLCSPEDRILLTVSGGIDSVVMTDLFVEAGFNAGMAHCNFGLRGRESDEDEEFAGLLAEHYSLEFHVKKFPTEKLAGDEGISIQMAARNLRYEWFEEIRESHGYDLIATAHNQDDVMETFFINFSLQEKSLPPMPTGKDLNIVKIRPMPPTSTCATGSGTNSYRCSKNRILPSENR